jgi:hypothetical protein
MTVHSAQTLSSEQTAIYYFPVHHQSFVVSSGQAECFCEVKLQLLLLFGYKILIK